MLLGALLGTFIPVCPGLLCVFEWSLEDCDLHLQLWDRECLIDSQVLS